MCTLDVTCCSLLGRIKFLRGIKSWIFSFCGGLSMFPLIFTNFSQDSSKTCVDSAPCCVLSAGILVCDCVVLARTPINLYLNLYSKIQLIIVFFIIFIISIIIVVHYAAHCIILMSFFFKCLRFLLRTDEDPVSTLGSQAA